MTIQRSCEKRWFISFLAPQVLCGTGSLLQPGATQGLRPPTCSRFFRPFWPAARRVGRSQLYEDVNDDQQPN